MADGNITGRPHHSHDIHYILSVPPSVNTTFSVQLGWLNRTGPFVLVSGLRTADCGRAFCDCTLKFVRIPFCPLLFLERLVEVSLTPPHGSKSHPELGSPSSPRRSHPPGNLGARHPLRSPVACLLPLAPGCSCLLSREFHALHGQLTASPPNPIHLNRGSPTSKLCAP